MKILCTSTSYLPAIGGAQLHMHQVSRELSSRHDIRVVTLWDSNRTDWLLGTTVRAPSTAREYAVDGIQVHRLGFSPTEKAAMSPAVSLYYLAQAMAIGSISSRLAKKIRSIGFDPDIVHNGRIGREPLSFASLQVARGLGVPFFLAPYHHPRWRGWWYRHFVNLYRAADGLITLTNAEKDLLSRVGVRPEKVFVTGMGPVLSEKSDPASFIELHQIAGPIVLFLGQHYRYKGFREVLQAARFVWTKIPEAHFVFIGPPVGGSERYFQAVDDPRIRRLGLVDLQTKTDALAACDLLCVPSRQESFGGVYTEAWAFEKPVIGCDISAVREVIEDGVNGFLVDQKAHLIAERITHLLLNPGLARKMGQAGRRRLEAEFTWGQIAARTEQAYLSVLRGGAQ
jgi:glycosyltransferase involved in cell wall biosynthesis